MAVSPVLKTSITKSDVSTSSKLRFYVKRELNVIGDAKLTRLSLYNIFKSMCDQELNYQELTSDLSISCFCRTGVVDTSVILEADSHCRTIEEHLRHMTLTTNAVMSIAKYISTLAVKSCVHHSSLNEGIRKSIMSQFCSGGTQKKTIGRRVFEEPLRKAQSIISPTMSRFGEKDFLKRLDKLTELFFDQEKSVTHGNFTSNNIVLKDSSSCGTAIIAFGSELSHVGFPMYDVGTFVGDLFLWYYIHKCNPEASVEREQFCETLRECIADFLSTYFDKFFLVVDDSVLTKLIGVTAGFAGVSMLFRAVGNDWNNELPIGSGSVRNAILGCACRLIDGFDKIETFCEVVSVGLMLP